MRIATGIAFSIGCFLAFLGGNFVLLRQDLMWTSGLGADYALPGLVFGVQSVVLLVVSRRAASRRTKLAALSGLAACILGFAFEMMLLINHVIVFEVRIGFA